MNLLLAFGFGCVAGSLFTQYWGAIRRAWGTAWGAVFGRPPARAAIVPSGISQEIPSGNVTEIPPEAPAVTEAAKPKIDFGRAVANVTGFVTGLIGWCARNPILAVGLVVLALIVLLGVPSCSPFGKSKDALRLERELAEANTRIAQHEARLGEMSRDLAVNTERDRSRRATVIAQAEQELGNAAAQIDPDALYDVYAAQYMCLLDARTCPSRADPAPSGPPPVRGSSSSPA